MGTAKRQIDPLAYVLTPADLALEVDDLLVRAHAGEIGVAQTGHPGIDRVTRMFDGSLTLVLGRPSHGKSMFGKTLVKTALRRIRASADISGAVIYVTLEETPTQIALAANGWDLSYHDVLDGKFDLDERRAQAARIATDNLFVIRHPGLVNGALPPALSPQMVYDAVVALAETYPADDSLPPIQIRLVVIDYIQIMQSDKLAMTRADKTAVVTAAIEGAKQLATDLRVPVVAMAQAGREVDSFRDQMPTARSCQHSSAGEQAADLIFAVHRPCRSDAAQEAIAAGERPSITYGGRQIEVTEDLLMVGLVKQRGGLGHGRWPVRLDPVTLDLTDLSGARS